MSHFRPSSSKSQIFFARTLRRSGNPAEKFLWSKLKDRRFCGLRFRKQVPYGPYILDFLCVAKNLVIEIDGDSHYQGGSREHDAKRDAYLKHCRLTILHVGHRETLQNIDGVLEQLRQYLQCPLP